MPESNRWILPTPEPDPDCRARLYCFPHAGGASGTYAGWTADLRPEFDARPVVLPGRDTRPDEPVPADMSTLADAAADGLAEHMRTGPALPYALFGHSLGAITAYETARRLSARGRPPALLIVSGSEAPWRTGERARDRHRWPDDEFLAEIARLGGSAAAGPEETELLRAILPRLRADYTIAETYTHVPGAPLTCPIAVYAGQEDDLVAEARLPEWARVGPPTSTPLVRRFPGGHFHLDDARPFVLRALRTDLAKALEGG
ncbi:thioesterase II family protein [Embleya sp. NPDC050493]|uniref:thioesterase II family protein n=1 Tax=Embleya sp. NPDC050493 TaxID=3363989 RepID=UPI0037ABA97F